jgi:APA family basic amino acid/polyamine antiporter
MAATGTRAEGAAREEEGGLRRVIGTRLLFFFVVGDMIGGGIYALVGEVGAEIGGAIWAAFLGAFLLAAMTAFGYAELVTKYPRAAGAALYVHKAFKTPFVTFMIAFAVMCSGIASAGALAKGFASDYFHQFVPAPDLLVALLFLAVITAINLVGISESVKVNAACTLIELGGLALILVVGVATLGSATADPGRALEFKEGLAPLAAVIAGTTLAFYALIGFEDSVNVAEEVREPRRAFPRALLGGMAVAGTIYLAVTIVASIVVPTDQLANSDAPLLEVVKEGSIQVSPRLFSLIALFALANGALINMIMASRLLFGMSKQGILPLWLSKLLPGRRTPWVAIAFTTALCAILIITGDLGVLADTTVMLLLLVFAAVNVSVLVLRKDRVEHEHFRAPSAFPVLGAIVCLYLVTQNEAAIYLRAGILLAVGLVFWAVNHLMSGRADEVEAEQLHG